MCLAFVRRTKPHGRNILCGHDVTCRIVAYGPGVRVKHGQFCRKHAERMAKSYAQPKGWTIEIEPVVAP